MLADQRQDPSSNTRAASLSSEAVPTDLLTIHAPAPDWFRWAISRQSQGLALPERARRALEALAEAGGLFRGVYEVAVEPAKPASADDIAQTREHIRELTKICEREIHEAVLSCTRARRQMPNVVSPAKPTVH